jgi:hypothetical protein
MSGIAFDRFESLGDSRSLPSLTGMTPACQGHRTIFDLFVSVVSHPTRPI